MKRVIAIGLFVNAALLAGMPLKNVVVVHAAGGDVPVGNGDVNGDGLIDISDAIYLLTNLFTGGPAVKPIECPPAPPTGALPDTGQTKCYALAGREIPCDSETCPGQDGSYSKGCPSEGRFVDNLDGTVTDHCTGLMWQKDTADVNGDGQIGDSDQIQWCSALAYCENLRFGGGVRAWDDWRLPNVRELQSIVDYGRAATFGGPSIDPVFGSVSTAYLSSTIYAGDVSDVWVVNFYDGGVNHGGVQFFSLYVRAVRGGI
jgi:hypothetical protein